MMEIYKGDAVTRYGDNDVYLVVQVTSGEFHLVSEKDNNRWNDNGIKFTWVRRHQEPMFITDTDIKIHYPSFELKEVIRKADRKKHTQICNCTKPGVSTQRLYEIASYSALKSASVGDLSVTVQRIVNDITRFLEKEGVIIVK